MSHQDNSGKTHKLGPRQKAYQYGFYFDVIIKILILKSKN